MTLMIILMIQLLDDTHEYEPLCVALRVLFYVFNLNGFQVTECSHLCSHAMRLGF